MGEESHSLFDSGTSAILEADLIFTVFMVHGGQSSCSARSSEAA